MNGRVGYSELDDALRRSGATWNAAQSHGLLCARLAVRGPEAGREWIEELAASAGQGVEPPNDSIRIYDRLSRATWQELAERQSKLAPLLPDDSHPPSQRAAALADWCEGYLHGLVSGPHPEPVRARLANEPLSEIIRDFLQITRAAADDEEDEDSNEEAYVELVEYVRVAAQLVYEELAGVRTPTE